MNPKLNRKQLKLYVKKRENDEKEEKRNPETTGE